MKLKDIEKANELREALKVWKSELSELEGSSVVQLLLRGNVRYESQIEGHPEAKAFKAKIVKEYKKRIKETELAIEKL